MGIKKSSLRRLKNSRMNAAASAYENQDVGALKTKSDSKRVPFAVVEAYKTIRTNLNFLLAGHKSGVFTVSSPDVADGKSTTAVNMAIAFSQLGQKTLIIDADMRRSSLHKKLKIENDVGLSNVLAGFVTADKAVKTVNEHLDILTAGQLPPNPSELLGSPNFKALIEEVSKHYIHVIIDTPPINVVTDALIVAPNSEGLVLVLRERYTTNDSIKRAVAAAELANIEILGAIINGINLKKKKGYNYRKYYSRKNYGKNDSSFGSIKPLVGANVNSPAYGTES